MGAGKLLLIALLFCSLKVSSQQLQQRLDLSFYEKPIAEVLQEITRQSGIEFSYDPQHVPVHKHITVNIKNRTVNEILEGVLIRNDIEYFRVEKHFVLKNKISPPDQHDNKKITPSGKNFTISGFIKEKATSEALIGANIRVKDTYMGITTNGYGFFSLTLPAGKHQLIISYVGYREQTKDVILDDNKVISIELAEVLFPMGEVEIVASGTETDNRQDQMSGISFSQKTLTTLPGFGGNLDVIRALQSVPGIHSFGDGSALYYVRGGNSDQNLLLIDEVPVYNPSHLFGFFSAFAPDAINEVQVYKGDFPARYGGRLSSVIDIKAKEGNLKQFGFSGNLGPYASTMSLEGPVIKNRASFFISGRISTLNWLTTFSALQKTFDFRFYDLNAKINFKINTNNRIFFTFYTGRDEFLQYASAEVNTYGIRWKNRAGTLRWNHVFNGRLFANTTLNYSRYDYTLTLPREQNGFWNSSISNLTLKSDITWYLNPDNNIRAGVEITNHESNPGKVELDNEVDDTYVPQVSPYHSMEYVLYLSNDQKIGKKFSLRYGLRLPIWQDWGAATVYYFDVNHKVIDTTNFPGLTAYDIYISPEPRLNLQYQINPVSSVKLSYCRTTQFMQLLSNSTSPFNSLEVWALAGPNIPPQKADQIALGYFREFFKARVAFSVEAYYKWFHDHLDYRDHANMLFNPLIEGELRFGTAKSFGIEVMVRKQTGKLTGWMGYTWSRAFITTPEVNNGESYPAFYDRPNDFSINLNYDTRKHWSFQVNWIYMTGAPITTPVGFYYNNGYSVPLYGQKNNDRLPDYHRLDLSFRYAFNKPGNRYQHSLSVTLYNAYGRLNPFSESYNKIMNDNGDFIVPSNLNGSYELVPTSISVAGIIPSINYQFKF